ncbi:Macrolide export protein MacA [Fundidesulfovibrio magnetotacticus]|uniref:Macrolide export protein MacA n=1 Tax=Fundidesulfovibrio magnetotacticus TaxID=2730080 RepID=A0A6V8M5B6_9BACT|nr:efflux RND transporter periplasmic adaptor subunit [Fundidesulfovibrio magnetotacticus]GFK95735.1 Macrolide export protein MacA [Fundidesulfovibrio magnetotacticus]
MTLRNLLLALAFLAATALPVRAQQPAAPAAPPAAPQAADPSPMASEIIFSGKLYSPLKLSVQLPFTSQIATMPTQIGQKVKKNDVLATFEIPMETRMAEKRNLNLAQVKEVEHLLSAANRDLEKFRVKRKELEMMEKQNLATSQALAQNALEIDAVEKQRVALTERLNLEKDMAQQRLELARDRFGPKANFGSLPNEGIVKAPVDGYVLWINPELRQGVKLSRDTELFQVGLLDPILIRAQVHEIEALRLKLGDKAKVTFDSLPGKTLEASISRIPWAPLPTALHQPSYYEIELTLPNPDFSLKEGLKAQVSITPKK